MSATIPLAKPYTSEKLVFPVYGSTKYDGVPVRVEINCKIKSFQALTRQGETMFSVQGLLGAFVRKYIQDRLVYGFPEHVVLVGEVLQRDNVFAPFKDTGGIVRRQKDQSYALQIKWFDAWQPNGANFDIAGVGGTFMARQLDFLRRLDLIGGKWCRAVEHTELVDQADLDRWWKLQQTAHPASEGVVFKGATYMPEAGKRSWQYQKGVVDPIIDLRIVGFEEGKGKNAGAVGRMIAEYKGSRIGIGPGKLSYAERKALWEREKIVPGCDLNRIAKIKVKVDPSYDALRQPTFQDWHHGKTEADA